jgi:hypothetical protein
MEANAGPAGAIVARSPANSDRAWAPEHIQPVDAGCRLVTGHRARLKDRQGRGRSYKLHRPEVALMGLVLAARACADIEKPLNEHRAGVDTMTYPDKLTAPYKSLNLGPRPS